MPKNKVIMVIAVCIALLPALGFPKAWESFFQVVAGLSIVGLSVWSTIDKKLALKAKAHQRQTRKPAASISITEPTLTDLDQHFGKRVTDFYPKTGQSGRRATDLRTDAVEEERI